MRVEKDKKEKKTRREDDDREVDTVVLRPV